ncbi:MAG TPA: diacylglycerol kinase family protein [Armatimonadota bacterium]|nr:diacylglycerol kinase family protein [Armatimonadota bacterium]
MSQDLQQEPVRELLETTCDLERVAIVFNPVSGTLDGEARRLTLETAARGAGLKCDLVETDKVAGARPLAEQAVRDGMERLLVSGGDGSATEAADALTGSGVTLALLPSGTGNLLALNLGIPTDCEEAMRLALTGQPRPFDVGRANGAAFLIMAGMGVDARMVHDADRAAKRRLGVLAYFIAAWRHLGRRFVFYTVIIDGRRIRRIAQSVIVANVGKITGGIEMVPGASPRDGLLDVAILRARGPIQMASLATRALLGRNRSDNLLEIHRGKRIVIQTPRPQLIEIDGNEVTPSNRLEITIEPSSLQLICPEPAGASTIQTVSEVLEAGGAPVWVPIGAAGAVTAALYMRSRSRRGRSVGFPVRHPFLCGLITGALVFSALRLLPEARGR